MNKKSMNMEIKSLDDKGTFIAYGSTFGNEDLVGDVVVEGAFAKSLSEKGAEGIYMFYNHDPSEIIGEYTNIKEDENGLLMEGKLFIDTIQRAKETYFLMQKNLIRKFSIGYRVIDEMFQDGKNYLKELDLIEVSPVTFPANPEANLLGVKNMNIKDMTIREFEDVLRDSGVSIKTSQEVISRLKSSLRDSEENKQEGSEDSNIQPVSAEEWGDLVKSLKQNNNILKGITNE